MISEGKTVTITVKGNSMNPFIVHMRDQMTLGPWKDEDIRKGTVALVKDIYGKPLSADTVTLEHIIPKSKGGGSNLKNYALANAEDNFKRSSENIMKHTTKANINEYLDQFTGIVKQGFNGDEYIKGIKNLFKTMGVKL